MTMGEQKAWSDEDKVFLTNNYKSMRTADIGIKLNRTISSIYQKARAMNLDKDKLNEWSTPDIAFVAINYPTIENHEIATVLGRTSISIENMAQKIGVSKIQKEREKKHDAWNNVEEVIKLYNSGMNRVEISEKMNCNQSTIQRILKTNGANMTGSDRNKKLHSMGKIKNWAKGMNKDNNSSIAKAAIKLSAIKKKQFADGEICINDGFLEWNKENKNKTLEDIYGKNKAEKIKKKKSEALKGRTFTASARKKMSIARKGKSYEEFYGKEKSNMIKKKMGENRIGEKNSSWLGGKSFEPYDASFNDKFKRAIRKRDNQICMLCNTHREKFKIALAVHHINYNKLLSIPQNCLSLCHSCHLKTNYNRKHWQTFFQNLLSEKYNYKYEDKEVIVEINPVGERSGLF